MKRSLMVVMALAVCALLNAGLWAAEGHDAHGARKAAPVQGELTKIDGKTLTLAQKSDAGVKESTVTIDDNTKIVVDGKPAKVEDLKVGQTVRANVAGHVATQVQAKTKAAKPAKERKAKQPK